MTTQPEALLLAQVAPYLEVGERGQWIMSAADELRRLHESNTELLSALKLAALAIHEYRNLGAPWAYWDDVQYQAYTAINKAERTTT